jgi:hypothetical protein
VTLQNDNLGTVVLPHAKISAITFGTAVAKNATTSATIASPSFVPDTNTDFASALRGLRDDTNLVQEVQSQILGSTSPEAVKKFNDLLDGLSTGQIDMNNLRNKPNPRPMNSAP